MTMTEVDEINDFTSLLVKNKSSQSVTFQWGQQIARLGPGEEKFILANAVFNTLGDPRSTNVAKSNISTRAEELKRVEAKWGLDVLDIGLQQQNRANIPDLEVYDPAGNRLYHVLEDPQGLKAQKIDITRLGHETLMNRISQLEQELSSLVRLIPKEDRPVEPERETHSKFNPLDVPEDD